MPNIAQAFVGILGWPLGYTLSPVLHAAAFRSLGLGWVYLTWPVQPEELARAVDGLRVLGARGANVTMPHKEAIIGCLDGVTADAAAIGAVNTVHVLGGKLIGHNTDVTGFAVALTEGTGFIPAGERCLVLGAGGSARAVVRALHMAGAAGVTVAARSLDKALEVAAIADGDATPWEKRFTALEDCSLVVNCTPLGMHGEDPLNAAHLSSQHVIFDLIYSPPQTPLVERAKRAGAAASGGLGMLVHQAADSLRIWTGSEAPIGIMSAAAIHAVRNAH